MMPIPESTQGQQRVVIERVTPEIDGGKWPVKAVPNEVIYAEANIFMDGHDKLAARLLYKHEKDKKWSEVTIWRLACFTNTKKIKNGVK